MMASNVGYTSLAIFFKDVMNHGHHKVIINLCSDTFPLPVVVIKFYIVNGLQCDKTEISTNKISIHYGLNS